MSSFSPGDLYTEVLAVIAERNERGWITNRAWLVTQILCNHPIKRPDKKDPDDFSVICRALAVSAAVDRALARMRLSDESGDPDELADLPLPKLAGYMHLRAVYPLKRDDGIMLVPIDQMTDAEIEYKIKVYGRTADALREHRNEFRRYLEQRRSSRLAV